MEPTGRPNESLERAQLTMGQSEQIDQRETEEQRTPPEPDTIFSDLNEKVVAYLPDSDPDALKRAYHFANRCHIDQKRRSGEPYITHPLEVACILTELKMDASSIVAAILHDTVEDTCATLDEIEQEFGTQVSELVDGLTKISKIKFRSNHEKQAENFRKMIVAMAKDVRVILIKLADRLHNMRTIGSMPEEKARRIAQETLDIYAPLANRLGIYGFKSELEDLCLRTLKFDIYKMIREKISRKKTARQAYIDEVISILDTELRKFGFKDGLVSGRPKHFYSIYKKMVDRKLEFEDIHDLFGFRIIVSSVKDCYEALGIVHAMWKPMPGRFKDYIAMPKANGYQSLHTTVIRPNGEPCEIQIRTEEMQQICEFGVAAHWSYKELGSEAKVDDLQKFSWLRQIVQLHNEVSDPSEFIEAVKVDLFDEEIFVFTPKGDVISLGHTATALDFAFAVHTDVGLRTIGAKVNGRMVPIRRVLNSGDIVEILTSPNQTPRKDWLNFVTSSKARSKIRSALRSEQRDRSRKIGQDLLEAGLSNLGLSYESVRKGREAEVLIKTARESNFDDILISLGYGKLQAEELLERAFPESKAKLPKPSDTPPPPDDLKIRKQSKHGVLVSGLDRVLVNFAKCCNPLPGEEIIGYVSRGRGVTVHRSNCLRALDMDPHRRIDVSWATNDSDGQHTAFLQVVTQDKPGVLAEVTAAISAAGANVQKAEVRVGPDLMGQLDFQLGLKNLQQLQLVINRLENLKPVISVERKSVLKGNKDQKQGGL